MPPREDQVLSKSHGEYAAQQVFPLGELAASGAAISGLGGLCEGGAPRNPTLRDEVELGDLGVIHLPDLGKVSLVSLGSDTVAEAELDVFPRDEHMHNCPDSGELFCCSGASALHLLELSISLEDGLVTACAWVHPRVAQQYAHGLDLVVLGRLAQRGVVEGGGVDRVVLEQELHDPGRAGFGGADNGHVRPGARVHTRVLQQQAHDFRVAVRCGQANGAVFLGSRVDSWDLKEAPHHFSVAANGSLTNGKVLASRRANARVRKEHLDDFQVAVLGTPAQRAVVARGGVNAWILEEQPDHFAVPKLASEDNGGILHGLGADLGQRQELLDLVSQPQLGRQADGEVVVERRLEVVEQAADALVAVALPRGVDQVHVVARFEMRANRFECRAKLEHVVFAAVSDEVRDRNLLVAGVRGLLLAGRILGVALRAVLVVSHEPATIRHGLTRGREAAKGVERRRGHARTVLHMESIDVGLRCEQLLTADRAGHNVRGPEQALKLVADLANDLARQVLDLERQLLEHSVRDELDRGLCEVVRDLALGRLGGRNRHARRVRRAPARGCRVGGCGR
mmetsp:Transcript_6659/g.21489  ORF Transcript_6659/g.21489 Transcript_6659/m.21489 type:complete len:568 (-) Transcript_6659:414-2117(-)